MNRSKDIRRGKSGTLQVWTLTAKVASVMSFKSSDLTSAERFVWARTLMEGGQSPRSRSHAVSSAMILSSDFRFTEDFTSALLRTSLMGGSLSDGDAIIGAQSHIIGRYQLGQSDCSPCSMQASMESWSSQAGWIAGSTTLCCFQLLLTTAGWAPSDGAPPLKFAPAGPVPDMICATSQKANMLCWHLVDRARGVSRLGVK